jgi:hypothetical protein
MLIVHAKHQARSREQADKTQSVQEVESSDVRLRYALMAVSEVPRFGPPPRHRPSISTIAVVPETGVGAKPMPGKLLHGELSHVALSAESQRARHDASD